MIGAGKVKPLLAAFSLCSMLPAVVNATPLAGNALMVPLCTSDGRTVTVIVPGQPQLPRRSGDDGCCVKGCHGGSSRKRFVRDN